MTGLKDCIVGERGSYLSLKKEEEEKERKKGRRVRERREGKKTKQNTGLLYMSRC